MSTPAGARRKPGSFNRSKAMAIGKRILRAKRGGVKPEAARRFTSAAIMAAAGKPGMLSVRRARKVCGYRWAIPSKDWPA